MNKSINLFIALNILSIICCHSIGTVAASENPADYGVPTSAVFADENDYYKIFINEDQPGKDIFNVPISSLWLYDKESKQASKLFTTVEPNDMYWYVSDDEQGIEVPIDSIPALFGAIAYDANRLIVSGVPDLRNIYSYIIDIPARKAIYIPCNRGILGFSSEEEYIVAQSYRYATDPEIAGRYTYIQVFDWNGTQVASLDLEMNYIDNGMLENYLDYNFNTKLKLTDYKDDRKCDFKFPFEEGEQRCWEYIYTLGEWDPRDAAHFDNLVATDKNWKKTKDGYHYTGPDPYNLLTLDINIDLKNKRIVLIHGEIK